MTRLITYIFLFSVGILTTYAHDHYDAYGKEQFVAKNGVKLNYRVLNPDTTMTKLSQYPLVIFLHGSGERGDDNTHQLDNGGKFFAEAQNRAQFPSYVIFPQCPENEFWSYKSAPTKPGPAGLKAEPQELPLMIAIQDLIEEYSKKPDVDSSRIYLVGISMGGMAVYDMLCRHPQTFAAAISICGAIDPERLSSMKDVPVRIFHGAKDDIIPPIAAEMVYDTLKSLGAEVELIEFPDAGHDSWDEAFAYQDFLSWLYSHTNSHMPTHEASLASNGIIEP